MIRLYIDFDVHVSTGSTITQFEILENTLYRLIKETASWVLTSYR